MHRIRTVVAIAAVLALTAALSATAGAQTTTTTGASSGGSTARGVTGSTVALVYPSIDTKALQNAGADIHLGDPKKIAAALAEGVNARGGIAGRKITIDVVPYDFFTPASIDAACVKITEDNEYFAAIVGFAVAEGNKCVLQHDTAIVGRFVTGIDFDDIDGSTPAYSAETSDTRQMALFAELLAKKGVFKGKTVGVVTGAESADATDEVLVPALRKAGVKPKVVLVDDAAGGDTAAHNANWDVFAEKLEAEGVDHVILVGPQSVSGYTAILDRKLDVGVSTPSAGILTTIGRSQTAYPPSAFTGAKTITALTEDEQAKTPAGKQCITDFKKANPGIKVLPTSKVPEGQDDWMRAILGMCSGLTMLKAIGDEVGKDLTVASLVATAAGMKGMSLPEGSYNSLGPTKHDANDGYRLAEFDGSIGKVGGLKPLGPLVNLGSG